MARIDVFEDSEDAVCLRYAVLTAEYEVHAHMTPDYFKSFEEGILGRSGFASVEMDALTIVEIPESVLYFVDGLNRECFTVLEILPKDKAVLLTGDRALRRLARKRGYAVFNEGNNIEDYVRDQLSEREPTSPMGFTEEEIERLRKAN